MMGEAYGGLEVCKMANQDKLVGDFDRTRTSDGIGHLWIFGTLLAMFDYATNTPHYTQLSDEDEGHYFPHFVPNDD